MADTGDDSKRRDDASPQAEDGAPPPRAASDDKEETAPTAGPRGVSSPTPDPEDRRADARTRLTEAQARLTEAKVRGAEVKAQERTRRAEARERRVKAREELRARKLLIGEAAALRRHRLTAVMLFGGSGFAVLFVALCLWFAFFGTAPQGEYARELLRNTAIALAGGGALHLVLHAVRAALRR